MNGFSLIETMRFEPEAGIIRLPLHLARLQRSARTLGFPGADKAEQRLAEALAIPPSALSGISPESVSCDPAVTAHFPFSPGGRSAEHSEAMRETGGRHRASRPPSSDPSGQLIPAGEKGSPGPLRARLTLDPTGEIAVTTAPFTPLAVDAVWRVKIAATRLDSADPLLQHKTTRRAVYEAARAEFPAADVDEVLLLNEKSEACEGTVTSLFLDDGSGTLKTPPIACGLLAGVLRTQMICQRRARVTRIHLDELRSGRLYVGNSLRGLIKAELVSE